MTPRVLIVAARDLSAQLGETVLWRSDIERVFSPSPEAALGTVANLGVGLVVMDADSPTGALHFIEELRRDSLTRSVSIAILGRSLSIQDEDALRVAGANVVLSGKVQPVIWDRRLDELLSVPRRREVRVPALCEAWSAIGSDPPLEGWALNLSIRGALLELEVPLDIGTTVALTLLLPGGSSKDVRSMARVVREAGNSDGRYLSGVEFLILRGDGQQRLLRYIGDTPRP